MNRRDFQQLARLRIKEARVLLDNGNDEGAYYLAGYAVECALKACIAKQTKAYDFPPEPSEIKGIYTHDLTLLLKPARLKADHDIELKQNAQFNSYWSIVRDWSEQSRYVTLRTKAEAQDLYRAISDRKNGVLQWLRKYW